MINPAGALAAPLAAQPLTRQRRLKLFCRRPLAPGQPTRELLAGFMDRIDCPELRLARLDPSAGDDVGWPTVLTLTLPDHALAKLSHSKDYAELVAMRLGVHIPALESPAYALVDERAVGRAGDSGRLTLAAYRWRPALRSDERTRAILALLERGRPIDQAVHAGALLARRGLREIDLLWEVYGDDRLAGAPPHHGCDLLEARWLAGGQVEIMRPDS